MWVGSSLLAAMLPGAVVRRPDRLSLTRRVALVAVWFGRLPAWFEVFQLTCARNPEIDWLLFSDQARPSPLPPNLRFLPCSIADFNRRVATLGFQATLVHPYKVCDYRPLLSLLFAEALDGYAFWGWCDLDVFWGRFRSFLDDGLLDRCDVYTTGVNVRLNGAMTLVRNTPRIGELGRHMPGLEAMLQSPQNLAVDESAFSRYLFSGLKGRLLHGRRAPVNKRFRFTGRAGLRILYQNVEALRLRFTETASIPRKYEVLRHDSRDAPVAIWLDGELYARHGEALLLHIGGPRSVLRTGAAASSAPVRSDAFVIYGDGRVRWLDDAPSPDATFSLNRVR